MQTMRPSLVAAIAASCVALVLGSGCARKSDGPRAAGADGLVPVRFHLDWYPQTEYGGYFQAQARGLYREAGLALEIIPGGPGIPFKEQVALGRADLGCTDGNDVIVAISRGLPLVIVAAEMQRNPQGLLFHEEDPLRTFDDLNGRPLVAGPGSAWVEYLQKSRGIQFELRPLVTDLTGFLADKHVVRQCFVTQEPFFAQARGARVGTLLIAESGYDPYRVIYTSRDFLAANPDLVRRFVAVSLRGFDDLLAGDALPAFSSLATVNPLMTPDIMAYSLSAMRDMHLIDGRAEAGERTGLITRERISQQIGILQSLGQLGRPLTVDEVATFEFVSGP